jgi:hypothetical protein
MKLSKLMFVTCLAGLGLYSACSEDPADSLFDPNRTDRVRAVVTALSPPDVALSGIGQITISGQNFASKPEENLVFFDAVRAQVVAASPTELVVKTPVLVGDSIQVKVAAHGAELFSEPVLYKMLQPVTDLNKMFDTPISFTAHGIATDLSGNVYYSATSLSFGSEIYKAGLDGEPVVFAEPSFLKASSMKFGPGNVLYAAASGRLKKIATFAPDGAESVYATLPLPKNPLDLDFDSSGNIWVVGGTGLARVKPDRSAELMATVSINGLLTVRIYDGYVYIGGIDHTSDENKIWRYQITGETIGAQELVLDVRSAEWLAGVEVLSFTFSENGDMILGTTHPDGLLVMKADGSGEPLYQGLLKSKISTMIWSEGNALYAVRQIRPDEEPDRSSSSQIYKILMPTNGAPYYGRQ